MSDTREENFDVLVASSADENTTLITTLNSRYNSDLQRALSTYDPENKIYSTYLKDTTSSETLTTSRIDELVDGAQSNLTNIMTLNAIIRKHVNKNDLIGTTYDAIEANVNTEYKCIFNKYPDQRNKSKQVKNAQAVIEDFLEQIYAKRIIRKAIPITYIEGTYIMYLRQKDENWIVDYYPLGVAEISDYESNGRPIVLINIQKLKSALSKTYLKDKKRKAVFFENQEKEVQENYPEEVYQAFKNGETYAKLDVDRCGVIRIDNLGRKYGLSPFVRALSPALMLETFDNADSVNAKARKKKIIVQTLRKELLGPNMDRKGYSEQIFAHDNLMRAFKQDTVVVTVPPYVEKIEYIEPKVDMTNKDTVLQYRNREMAALGISFLNSDGTQTVSTANISLNQLLKNINKISEQLEDVFKDWFRVVLRENNIDLSFCPEIKIEAAEMMDYEVRKSIANFLFTTLGCSYKTAYEQVGVDIDDERQKRESENEESFEEIFKPHQTSATVSGGGGVSDGGSGNSDGEGKAGRPKGEATDKQAYDKARNDAMK